MTQPRLVGGRYELGELIGYGGMAEVHRGRDIRLGREVAIKVLRADLARDPSFLNRFRREAQAAAGLNHPSIVSVYDTGEDVNPDGTVAPFIVMEYVEGRTLRDIIKAEGRLPARRAMEIAADVCGALDFSHRNGLIHRDIKPANVMITQAGAVKVMDFGIARTLADDAATVTQTANVIGTAQYLSPEQARGETVDGRSDVYSTGCLLYELVTGVPPFQGDSPVAVAYQHVRENAPTPSSRVPDLPRVLDSIVMKSIAKNVLNRYQTAGEMRSDLQRALADQPITAETVMTDDERTQMIARAAVPAIVPVRAVQEVEYDEPERRTGLIWAAVVAALVLVIVAGLAAVLLLRNSGSSTPKVTIPDGLIGVTPQVARTKLGPDVNFSPNRAGGTTNGPCDDGSTPTTEGVVCKVTDASGATVHAGDKVPQKSTIYYQTYIQAKTNVPFVKGLSVQDATSLLTSKGFKFTLKSVDTADTPGTVTDQSPDVNTPVPPGSTVVLTVSTGKLKLPDVRGKKSADALRQLNQLGFVNTPDPQSQPTNDQSKDGLIATETPFPGNTYLATTQITLTVYKYVPAQPSCSSSSPSSPGGSSSTTPPPGSSSSASGTGLPPCTSSSS